MNNEYDEVFSDKLTDDKNFDSIFGADEDDKLIDTVEAACGETNTQGVEDELDCDKVGTDMGPDNDTKNKPTDDTSDVDPIAKSEDEEIDLVDGTKANVCPEHISDEAEKLKKTKKFEDNRFDEAYNDLMKEALEDSGEVLDDKEDHSDDAEDNFVDDLDSKDDSEEEPDDSEVDVTIIDDLDDDSEDDEEEPNDTEDDSDEDSDDVDDDFDDVDDCDNCKEDGEPADPDTDKDDEDDVAAESSVDNAADEIKDDDDDIDIVDGGEAETKGSKKILKDLKDQDPDDDVLDDEGNILD